jgi:hypothetical protein
MPANRPIVDFLIFYEVVKFLTNVVAFFLTFTQKNKKIFHKKLNIFNKTVEMLKMTGKVLK